MNSSKHTWSFDKHNEFDRLFDKHTWFCAKHTWFYAKHTWFYANLFTKQIRSKNA